MSQTVYVLGAGANQSVTVNGHVPPLARNFFSLVADEDDAHVSWRRRTGVFDYIERYWKKTRADVARVFDLEEMFTLLQLQMSEAFRRDKMQEYRELSAIYDTTTSWLTEYLVQFDGLPAYVFPMRDFGGLLLRERSTVITFNYDCIVEAAIAAASGVRAGPYPGPGDTSDLAIVHSHHNWNRALAYGIRFDEVDPYRAGVTQPIDGNVFYDHPANQLYDAPVLKLHGSINWFRYLPVRADPAIGAGPRPSGTILETRGNPTFAPPNRRGWMVQRELVTPVLYKQPWLETDLFERLWASALKNLRECKRLVVIGYSFPPTDFATKRLFLEAFVDREPLEALTIVNPDSTVTPLVKNLTHHTGAVTSMDTIDDYVRLTA